MKSGSQLVDSRFHRKQALGRTIAAVRTGRHMVGVDHVADKTEGFGLAIQRDGLVAGKAHRCGAVLTISTGVGQGVEVDALHDAVPGGTQTDVHLHLVAGRRCGLALFAGED